jgi:hypothetical protein
VFLFELHGSEKLITGQIGNFFKFQVFRDRIAPKVSALDVERNQDFGTQTGQPEFLESHSSPPKHG